jgi:hypothetical protein
MTTSQPTPSPQRPRPARARPAILSERQVSAAYALPRWLLGTFLPALLTSLDVPPELVAELKEIPPPHDEPSARAAQFHPAMGAALRATAGPSSELFMASWDSLGEVRARWEAQRVRASASRAVAEGFRLLDEAF